MKLNFPGGLRPNFYDRPIAYEVVSRVITVGPHAFAEQDVYQVLANRRGFLVSVYFYMRRATVAAPVGMVTASIRGWLNGSAYYDLFAVHFLDNNVDAKVDLSIPCFIPVRANDSISIWTGDIGTGGTVQYLINAVLVTTYL